jgi:hypothetical protein
MDFITKPLTPAELVAAADKDNFISVNVALDVDTMIYGGDIENFLDDLSDKAVGTTLLMDVSYRAVGVTDDGLIIFKVEGDITAILETEAENADED